MEKEAMSQALQLYKLKKTRKEVFSLFKTRQQASNEVTYVKFHVTNQDLI